MDYTNRLADRDYPETAKGKRLEARAMRQVAIRQLRLAEDLDGFADAQEAREDATRLGKLRA